MERRGIAQNKNAECQMQLMPARIDGVLGRVESDLQEKMCGTAVVDVNSVAIPSTYPIPRPHRLLYADLHEQVFVCFFKIG